MDDTKKMFQKIINGQSAMKSELLVKISRLEEKVDKGFDEMKTQFRQVHKRIDKIGLQAARLEDDAPTIEEFDRLEKRVSKFEHKLSSV